MLTQLDRDNARLKGIAAYKSGQHFGQCPVEGFGPEAIELRWQWQKGWLRANEDQLEKDKQTNQKKPT